VFTEEKPEVKALNRLDCELHGWGSCSNPGREKKYFSSETAKPATQTKNLSLQMVSGPFLMGKCAGVWSQSTTSIYCGG